MSLNHEFIWEMRVIAARGAVLTLRAVREAVANVPDFPASVLRLSATGFQSSSDPCAPGTSGPSDTLKTEQGLNIAIAAINVGITALDITAQGFKFVHDVSAKGCAQTVAGFNTAMACVPAIIVFHIADGLSIIAKGVNRGIKDIKTIGATNAKILSASDEDDAKACTKTIADEFKTGGKIVMLQDDVTLLKTDVGLLKNTTKGTADKVILMETTVNDMKLQLDAIELLLKDNRDLLLTPTGLREKFPNPN